MSQDFIQHLHNTPTRAVLALTGGGSRAIAELLEVPGGSRTLLSALVPYSSAALVEWLGATPAQFCSAETARRMAMRAWMDARRWADDASTPLAGVGCTASLVSERAKHGAHRVHVAWQTAEATCCESVELVKGRRSRVEEEQVVSRMILNLLAEASGLSERLDPGLQPDEPVTREHVVAWEAIRELIVAPHTSDQLCIVDKPRVRPENIVFPGAFNPRHAGHDRMAALAAQLLGDSVGFEISVTNVDKPPLDYIDIEHRKQQFPHDRLWLTARPTFAEKAKAFPGATFIVGLDTIQRIADPRYYQGSELKRDLAIEFLAAQGCKFLIFGRRVGERFETLSSIELPPQLAALCREVTEREFREDVSSTELRGKD